MSSHRQPKDAWRGGGGGRSGPGRPSSNPRSAAGSSGIGKWVKAGFILSADVADIRTLAAAMVPPGL